jgi:hypothetical protein
MATWYYYDYLGVRQTVLSDAELRNLAENGMITAETIIESEAGRTVPAGRINGLVFPPPPPPPPQITVPVPGTENEHEEEEPLAGGEIPVQLLICRAASILPGFGHLIMGCGISTCVPVFVFAFLKHFLFTFIVAIIHIAIMSSNPRMFIVLIPVDLLLFPVYLFFLFRFIYVPIIRDIDREYYYRFQR